MSDDEAGGAGRGGRKPASGMRRGGWNRVPVATGDDAGEVEAEAPAAMHRRAYATAIKLLGARDHSRAEIRRKLAERDVEEDVIDAVVEELVEHRYLNDGRYARQYIEQRAVRGYGPRAIEAKLSERGIDRSEVRVALEEFGGDWVALAGEALTGKFRGEEIVDPEAKVRGKIARFLQGRGFSAGDSVRAVEVARGRIVADGEA